MTQEYCQGCGAHGAPYPSDDQLGYGPGGDYCFRCWAAHVANITVPSTGGTGDFYAQKYGLAGVDMD